LPCPRSGGQLACTFDECIADEQRVRSARQEAPDPDNTGADEVTSISYLPQTFATLFFIAASLLLGLMR
jgi:hypothetical protein